MANEFQFDVFLSHSAKAQPVLRTSSLSASIRERISRTERSRFEPLNQATGDVAQTGSRRHRRFPTCATGQRFMGRAGMRSRILKLAEGGIDFPAVSAQVRKPEADQFGLQRHGAVKGLPATRRNYIDSPQKNAKAENYGLRSV